MHTDTPTPPTEDLERAVENDGAVPELADALQVGQPVERFYKLPVGLAEALVKYLNGRPYGEVQQGMQGLLALELVEVPVEQPEKDEPKD